MKLNKKTVKALAAAKAARAAKNGKVKTAKTKAVKVKSHQWKTAKELGVDKLLGHGGLYCLRNKDITGNLFGAKASGKASRQVALFEGEQGLCFIDGAFVGKTANFGSHGIDTAQIKRMRYFGGLAGAIAFVQKNGKREAGATNKGERFTHYMDTDAHYAVATDGKRLLRLEARDCSGTAKNYTWTLGK